MSDHAAFLAAIVAQPDDDLPRLVFADWLDEHGEPERAEFVRVQIAFDADYGPHEQPANKDGELLRRRMFELLRDPRNFVNWTPRLMHTGSGAGICCESASEVALTGVGFRRAMFRRGFLSQIECTWEAWQTHAAALLAACPIRRRLVHPDKVNGGWTGDGLVRLTTWPDWAGSSLGVAIGARDGTLERLAAERPGVRFELPTAPVDLTLAEIVDHGERLMAAARAAVAQQFAMAMNRRILGDPDGSNYASAVAADDQFRRRLFGTAPVSTGQLRASLPRPVDAVRSRKA